LRRDANDDDDAGFQLFSFPLVISSREKESESCVIIVISVISARATAHVSVTLDTEANRRLSPWSSATRAGRDAVGDRHSHDATPAWIYVPGRGNISRNS